MFSVGISQGVHFINWELGHHYYLSNRRCLFTLWYATLQL